MIRIMRRSRKGGSALGLWISALGLWLTAFACQAAPYPLVVVEARGGQHRPGARIDSNTPIVLKVGEKLVVITPDGRISTLRGAYQGPPVQSSGPVQNPRLALAALISTRNDRANSVGAVRSGASAAPLPSPWLIDISRPGERCVIEGEKPVWWRPVAGEAGSFNVYPVDRSWQADFRWEANQQTIEAPNLMRLDGMKMMIIKTGAQERPIRLHIIPREIDTPMVLVAWMLDKACIQQADALLRQVETGLAPDPTPQATTAQRP